MFENLIVITLIATTIGMANAKAATTNLPPAAPPPSAPPSMPTPPPDQPGWLPSYDIKCGQIAHKAVFDPRDVSGTMVDVVLTAHATRIPGAKLPGAYWGGGGYAMDATLIEPALLKLTVPLHVQFDCYFTKDVTFKGYPSSTAMTCPSVIGIGDDALVPNIQNFNMVTAKLPIPSEEGLKATWFGSSAIKLRTYERASEGGLNFTRYYDTERELACQMTPN